MAIILIKIERTANVNGQERVVSKGNQWYIEDTSKDFHTSQGIIPKEILQKEGKHQIDKNEYVVFNSKQVDDFKQLKQDVQRIVNKDLGFMYAFCGMDQNTIFAESGTGSGGATTFFAPRVKKVYSYDIREDAKTKLEKDCAKFNITNVHLKTASVSNKEDIDAKDVDAFLLDVPQPWDAWETMEKCVAVGGFVIGYTINANQLQQFVNEAPKNFMKVHACEIMERHWKVKGQVIRPESADFSHTAFLSFFRKIY